MCLLYSVRIVRWPCPATFENEKSSRHFFYHAVCNAAWLSRISHLIRCDYLMNPFNIVWPPGISRLSGLFPWACFFFFPSTWFLAFLLQCRSSMLAVISDLHELLVDSEPLGDSRGFGPSYFMLFGIWEACWMLDLGGPSWALRPLTKIPLTHIILIWYN